MSTKLTKFSQIKPFIDSGDYEVTYGLEYGLKQLKEFEEEQGLQLSPDFQREHVWTEEQQIAYVEYFLRGGVTGRIFYLNHPGWMGSFKGEFVLVDGKQRIQALRRFVNNEIPVFGSYFNEFTDRERFKYKFEFRVNVNKLKTRKEVLQWYIEMNSGGTPHTKEEIEKVKNLLNAEESSEPS